MSTVGATCLCPGHVVSEPKLLKERHITLLQRELRHLSGILSINVSLLRSFKELTRL